MDQTIVDGSITTERNNAIIGLMIENSDGVGITVNDLPFSLVDSHVANTNEVGLLISDVEPSGITSDFVVVNSTFTDNSFKGIAGSSSDWGKILMLGNNFVRNVSTDIRGSSHQCFIFVGNTIVEQTGGFGLIHDMTAQGLVLIARNEINDPSFTGMLILNVLEAEVEISDNLISGAGAANTSR